MEASQRYLEKIINEYISDIDEKPESFPCIAKIKRYGEYCKYEGIIDTASSGDIIQVTKQIILKKLKEDNLY